MADIKINGNTYTGVTKLLAKKSDGNGEQAFVIPELESRTVNLGSSAPSSVTPSAGKDGISSVDFSIDSTVIAPGNIAKGVTVLGVAGTLEAGGSAAKKLYRLTIELALNPGGGTTPTYYVHVSITDGDNTMAITNTPTLNGDEILEDVITFILKTNENIILEKFPTNQWIYQWIISSELVNDIEVFFIEFNVEGDRNLMDALLHGRSVSNSAPKNGVLVFMGY